MNVYTLNGKQLTLKEPPFNSGGEGSIHEITGYPDMVAKIYRNRSDALAREGKITEMVKICTTPTFQSSNLLQSIAWPLSPLFDANRDFIGFGMVRVPAGKELDELYVYPPKRKFGITTLNKVNCLISLCNVIDRLHRAGQVFGDFNPNNIKIRDDWSVNFVDADSYHINNTNKTYRCVVCAPGYVAPEVIKACTGMTYADAIGQTFTRESDNFALAVHCFRMLMNGCHPFTGKIVNKGVRSMPSPVATDKRVEKGETPFFRTLNNVTTPDYVPDIDALPQYLRSLFQRAFVDGHMDPRLRPNASEWESALTKFRSELKQCSSNRNHFYHTGNRSCPYCEADYRYQTMLKATYNVPFPQNHQTVVPQTVATPVRIVTTTYTQPTPTYSSSYNNSDSALFWIVTSLLSIAAMLVLRDTLLPAYYYDVIEDPNIAGMCVGGSMIAGFIGTFLYNSRWSPGKSNGHREWYEYILSLMVALGFVVGFGICLAALVVAFYILLYIVMLAAVIGFLYALVTGG